MSKFSIQNIFQTYGPAYIKTHKLSHEQWKVYNSIINCKTEALGIHTITCEDCGDTHTALNSCRNRHCYFSSRNHGTDWQPGHSQKFI